VTEEYLAVTNKYFHFRPSGNHLLYQVLSALKSYIATYAQLHLTSAILSANLTGLFSVRSCISICVKIVNIYYYLMIDICHEVSYTTAIYCKCAIIKQKAKMFLKRN